MGLGGFAVHTALPKGIPEPKAAFSYVLADRVEAIDLPIAASARLPFRWPAFGVFDKPVTLSFQKPGRKQIAPALFRISVAIDIREEKRIEVILPVSNRKLGTLDIRYSPVFQPFELALSAEQVEAVFREGVALKQIQGESPVWFFQPKAPAPMASQGLLPHLLFHAPTKQSIETFYSNFLSLNSVQSFGWMEGCVLDGLLDLRNRFPGRKSKSVLDAHLNLFFDETGHLVYEGPFSRPYENKFYGIEAFLPFATLAQIQPNHPILPLAADYLVQKADGQAVIQDKHLTTEGCYTLGYPLASLAIALNRPDLALLAIKQFTERQKRLCKDDIIYQRLDEKGELHYPNWGRGAAWYLLGLVRTLTLADKHEEVFRALKPEIAALKAEFTRAAQSALALRQPEGIWMCFLDQPETGPDTSGSAGIAAALAIGVRHHYLPVSVSDSIQKALHELLSYLTPDGFLSGASQANKGGIALQKSGYRVISQYASGLMGQLIAAQTGP